MPADDQRATHAHGATVFIDGERIPSITPQSDGLNGQPNDTQRIYALPRALGHTGNVWSQDYVSRPGDDRSAAYDHRNLGTDLTWHDAQYGASPLRSARYAEDQRHRPQDTDTPDTTFDGQRPGAASQQSAVQGKGHDERGDYGSASDSQQPENYSN